MDTKTKTVRAITDEMRRAAGAETDPARLYGWADRIDQAQARREAEAAREASEAAARAFERGEESGARASGAPMTATQLRTLSDLVRIAHDEYDGCESYADDIDRFDRLLADMKRGRSDAVAKNACAPMGLDEAIEHAEKRADETPCGRAHGQLAGWLRELRDKRAAAGNGAEIRAALEYVLRHVTVGWAYPDARKLILAALDAPPRNCDRCRTRDEAENAFLAQTHVVVSGPTMRRVMDWMLATAEKTEAANG